MIIDINVNIELKALEVWVQYDAASMRETILWIFEHYAIYLHLPAHLYEAAGETLGDNGFSPFTTTFHFVSKPLSFKFIIYCSGFKGEILY